MPLREPNFGFHRLNRERGERSVSFRYALNQSILSTPYGEHIVDDLAIVDPLLARLPSRPEWRPGHFARTMPLGYPDLLRSGTNLCDQNLARYHDYLLQLTRAPIFSLDRIRTIVAMNFGRFDHLVDRAWYREPSIPTLSGAEAQAGALARCRALMTHRGIVVRFDGIMRAKRLQLELDSGSDYFLRFMKSDSVLAEAVAFEKPAAAATASEMGGYEVEVPRAAFESGYDGLWIVPPADSVASDDARYSFGRLILGR